MKTVGELLKETRESKNLTLDQVAKATRIQKRYLAALEKNDFKQISTQEYAKGYVKNYSEFLGLNSRNVLAFFRRQTQEIPKSALLPKPDKPIKHNRFQLTPGKFVGLVVVTLLIVFVFYFILQYQRLQAPPILVLEQPKDTQEVVQSQRIDILGQTDPDATVAINGIGVLVRSDGKFFDQVQVFPGENTITIVATSRYGKTTTITRTISVAK